MNTLEALYARSNRARVKAAQLGALSLESIAKTAGADSSEWLAQFEGTPLQEQAVSIAQQEVQKDIQEVQRETARKALEDEHPEVFRFDTTEDANIRAQKHMLELQLAQQKLEQSNPLDAGPQGSGAVGGEVDPGADTKTVIASAHMPGYHQVEVAEKPLMRLAKHIAAHPGKASNIGTVGGAVLGGYAGSKNKDEKGKSDLLSIIEGSVAGSLAGRALGRGAETLSRHVSKKPVIEVFTKNSSFLDQAQDFGRELAQEEVKQASAEKTAGIGGALSSALSALKASPLAGKAIGGARQLASNPMVSKAVQFAKSNPSAALGAVGAAGGLAHGLQKDETGHRSLTRGLGEAAAGGALGAATGKYAPGIISSLKGKMQSAAPGILQGGGGSVPKALSAGATPRLLSAGRPTPKLLPAGTPSPKNVIDTTGYSVHPSGVPSSTAPTVRAPPINHSVSPTMVGDLTEGPVKLRGVHMAPPRSEIASAYGNTIPAGPLGPSPRPSLLTGAPSQSPVSQMRPSGVSIPKAPRMPQNVPTDFGYGAEPSYR